MNFKLFMNSHRFIGMNFVKILENFVHWYFEGVYCSVGGL